MASLLFCLLFCFALVSAFLPAATVVRTALEAGCLGESPWPTDPPSVHELHRRQSFYGKTVIVAPDSICGYESGSSASPLAFCTNGYRCAFGTASSAAADMYCCDSGTVCGARRSWTTCLDAATQIASCNADTKCVNNGQVLKCISNNYCNTAGWAELIALALFCDSTTHNGIILVSTTYIGQVGRTFVPLPTPAQATTTLTPSTIMATTSSSTTGSTSSTSTSTILTLTPTPTPIPPLEPQTPVAAIAGGVVGGVVFVAMLATVFIFLRIRKRKRVTSPFNAHSFQPESQGISYSKDGPPPPPHDGKFEMPIAQVSPVYQSDPEQYVGQPYPPPMQQQAFPSPGQQQQPFHQHNLSAGSYPGVPTSPGHTSVVSQLSVSASYPHSATTQDHNPLLGINSQGGGQNFYEIE